MLLFTLALFSCLYGFYLPFKKDCGLDLPRMKVSLSGPTLPRMKALIVVVLLILCRNVNCDPMYVTKQDIHGDYVSVPWSVESLSGMCTNNFTKYARVMCYPYSVWNNSCIKEWIGCTGVITSDDRYYAVVGSKGKTGNLTYAVDDHCPSNSYGICRWCYENSEYHCYGSNGECTGFDASKMVIVNVSISGNESIRCNYHPMLRMRDMLEYCEISCGSHVTLNCKAVGSLLCINNGKIVSNALPNEYNVDCFINNELVFHANGKCRLAQAAKVLTAWYMVILYCVLGLFCLCNCIYFCNKRFIGKEKIGAILFLLALPQVDCKLYQSVHSEEQLYVLSDKEICNDTICTEIYSVMWYNHFKTLAFGFLDDKNQTTVVMKIDKLLGPVNAGRWYFNTDRFAYNCNGGKSCSHNLATRGLTKIGTSPYQIGNAHKCILGLDSVCYASGYASRDSELVQYSQPTGLNFWYYVNDYPGSANLLLVDGYNYFKMNVSSGNISYVMNMEFNDFKSKEYYDRCGRIVVPDVEYVSPSVETMLKHASYKYYNNDAHTLKVETHYTSLNYSCSNEFDMTGSIGRVTMSGTHVYKLYPRTKGTVTISQSCKQKPRFVANGTDVCRFEVNGKIVVGKEFGTDENGNITYYCVDSGTGYKYQWCSIAKQFDWSDYIYIGLGIVILCFLLYLFVQIHMQLIRKKKCLHGGMILITYWVLNSFLIEFKTPMSLILWWFGTCISLYYYLLQKVVVPYYPVWLFASYIVTYNCGIWYGLVVGAVSYFAFVVVDMMRRPMEYSPRAIMTFLCIALYGILGSILTFYVVKRNEYDWYIAIKAIYTGYCFFLAFKGELRRPIYVIHTLLSIWGPELYEVSLDDSKYFGRSLYYTLQVYFMVYRSGYQYGIISIMCRRYKLLSLLQSTNIIASLQTYFGLYPDCLTATGVGIVVGSLLGSSVTAAKVDYYTIFHINWFGLCMGVFVIVLRYVAKASVAAKVGKKIRSRRVYQRFVPCREVTVIKNYHRLSINNCGTYCAFYSMLFWDDSLDVVPIEQGLSTDQLLEYAQHVDNEWFIEDYSKGILYHIDGQGSPICISVGEGHAVPINYLSVNGRHFFKLSLNIFDFAENDVAYGFDGFEYSTGDGIELYYAIVDKTIHLKCSDGEEFEFSDDNGLDKLVCRHCKKHIVDHRLFGKWRGENNVGRLVCSLCNYLFNSNYNYTIEDLVAGGTVPRILWDDAVVLQLLGGEVMVRYEDKIYYANDYCSINCFKSVPRPIGNMENFCIGQIPDSDCTCVVRRKPRDKERCNKVHVDDLYVARQAMGELNTILTYDEDWIHVGASVLDMLIYNGILKNDDSPSSLKKNAEVLLECGMYTDRYKLWKVIKTSQYKIIKDVFLRIMGECGSYKGIFKDREVQCRFIKEKFNGITLSMVVKMLEMAVRHLDQLVCPGGQRHTEACHEKIADHRGSIMNFRTAEIHNYLTHKYIPLQECSRLTSNFRCGSLYHGYGYINGTYCGAGDVGKVLHKSMSFCTAVAEGIMTFNCFTGVDVNPDRLGVNCIKPRTGSNTYQWEAEYVFAVHTKYSNVDAIIAPIIYFDKRISEMIIDGIKIIKKKKKVIYNGSEEPIPPQFEYYYHVGIIGIGSNVPLVLCSRPCYTKELNNATEETINGILTTDLEFDPHEIGSWNPDPEDGPGGTIDIKTFLDESGVPLDSNIRKRDVMYILICILVALVSFIMNMFLARIVYSKDIVAVVYYFIEGIIALACVAVIVEYLKYLMEPDPLILYYKDLVFIFIFLLVAVLSWIITSFATKSTGINDLLSIGIIILCVIIGLVLSRWMPIKIKINDISILILGIIFVVAYVIGSKLDWGRYLVYHTDIWIVLILLIVGLISCVVGMFKPVVIVKRKDLTLILWLVAIFIITYFINSMYCTFFVYTIKYQKMQETTSIDSDGAKSDDIFFICILLITIIIYYLFGSVLRCMDDPNVMNDIMFILCCILVVMLSFILSHYRPIVFKGDVWIILLYVVIVICSILLSRKYPIVRIQNILVPICIIIIVSIWLMWSPIFPKMRAKHEHKHKFKGINVTKKQEASAEEALEQKLDKGSSSPPISSPAMLGYDLEETMDIHKLPKVPNDCFMQAALQLMDAVCGSTMHKAYELDPDSFYDAMGLVKGEQNYMSKVFNMFMETPCITIRQCIYQKHLVVKLEHFGCLSGVMIDDRLVKSYDCECGSIGNETILPLGDFILIETIPKECNDTSSYSIVGYVNHYGDQERQSEDSHFDYSTTKGYAHAVGYKLRDDSKILKIFEKICTDSPTRDYIPPGKCALYEVDVEKYMGVPGAIVINTAPLNYGPKDVHGGITAVVDKYTKVVDRLYTLCPVYELGENWGIIHFHPATDEEDIGYTFMIFLWFIRFIPCNNLILPLFGCGEYNWERKPIIDFYKIVAAYYCKAIRLYCKKQGISMILLGIMLDMLVAIGNHCINCSNIIVEKRNLWTYSEGTCKWVNSSRSIEDAQEYFIYSSDDEEDEEERLLDKAWWYYFVGEGLALLQLFYNIDKKYMSWYIGTAVTVIVVLMYFIEPSPSLIISMFVGYIGTLSYIFEWPKALLNKIKKVLPYKQGNHNYTKVVNFIQEQDFDPLATEVMKNFGIYIFLICSILLYKFIMRNHANNKWLWCGVCIGCLLGPWYTVILGLILGQIGPKIHYRARLIMSLVLALFGYGHNWMYNVFILWVFTRINGGNKGLKDKVVVVVIPLVTFILQCTSGFIVARYVVIKTALLPHSFVSNIVAIIWNKEGIEGIMICYSVLCTIVVYVLHNDIVGEIMALFGSLAEYYYLGVTNSVKVVVACELLPYPRNSTFLIDLALVLIRVILYEIGNTIYGSPYSYIVHFSLVMTICNVFNFLPCYRANHWLYNMYLYAFRMCLQVAGSISILNWVDSINVDVAVFLGNNTFAIFCSLVIGSLFSYSRILCFGVLVIGRLLCDKYGIQNNLSLLSNIMAWRCIQVGWTVLLAFFICWYSLGISPKLEVGGKNKEAEDLINIMKYNTKIVEYSRVPEDGMCMYTSMLLSGNWNGNNGSNMYVQHGLCPFLEGLVKQDIMKISDVNDLTSFKFGPLQAQRYCSIAEKMGLRFVFLFGNMNQISGAKVYGPSENRVAFILINQEESHAYCIRKVLIKGNFVTTGSLDSKSIVGLKKKDKYPSYQQIEVSVSGNDGYKEMDYDYQWWSLQDFEVSKLYPDKDFIITSLLDHHCSDSMKEYALNNIEGYVHNSYTYFGAANFNMEDHTYKVDNVIGLWKNPDLITELKNREVKGGKIGGFGNRGNSGKKNDNNNKRPHKALPNEVGDGDNSDGIKLPHARDIYRNNGNQWPVDQVLQTAEGDLYFHRYQVNYRWLYFGSVFTDLIYALKRFVYVYKTWRWALSVINGVAIVMDYMLQLLAYTETLEDGCYAFDVVAEVHLINNLVNTYKSGLVPHSQHSIDLMYRNRDAIAITLDENYLAHCQRVAFAIIADNERDEGNTTGFFLVMKTLTEDFDGKLLYWSMGGIFSTVNNNKEVGGVVKVRKMCSRFQGMKNPKVFECTLSECYAHKQSKSFVYYSCELAHQLYTGYYPCSCVCNSVQSLYSRLFNGWENMLNQYNLNIIDLHRVALKLHNLPQKPKQHNRPVDLESIINSYTGLKKMVYRDALIKGIVSRFTELFVKQELTALKDGEAKDPRPICGSDKEYVILYRHLCGLYEDELVNSVYCAKTCNYKERAELILQNSEKYKYIFQTDLSRCDGHIGNRAILLETLYYLEKEPEAIRTIFTDASVRRIVNKYINCRPLPNRLSGDPTTAVHNVFHNLLIFMMLKERYDISIVNDGDDNLWFSNDPNFGAVIVDAYNQYGFECECEQVTLNSLIFCKTKLYHGNFGYTMVRDPMQILKNLCITIERPGSQFYLFMLVARCISNLTQTSMPVELYNFHVDVIRRFGNYYVHFLKTRNISPFDIVDMSVYLQATNVENLQVDDGILDLFDANKEEYESLIKSLYEIVDKYEKGKAADKDLLNSIKQYINDFQYKFSLPNEVEQRALLARRKALEFRRLVETMNYKGYKLEAPEMPHFEVRIDAGPGKKYLINNFNFQHILVYLSSNAVARERLYHLRAAKTRIYGGDEVVATNKNLLFRYRMGDVYGQVDVTLREVLEAGIVPHYVIDY